MADRPTKHRTMVVDVDAIPTQTSGSPPLPWYAVAVLGTVAALAVGWLLLAGATALGWLTSPDAELKSAMRLATDMLLLAHGVPVVVGGQLVTLIPLGLTLALVALIHPVSSLAARQAAGTMAPADDTGRIWVNGEAVVLRVAGAVSITHGLLVAVLAAATNAAGGALSGLVGGVALGAISSLWGASRAVGFDPCRTWPAWLRSVPRAMGFAVLVCLAGGMAALMTTLIIHGDRIAFIHEALKPGIAGGILLVLVQLLYLPNLVLWATSWILGAGITLGDDSLLSMAVTDVGFLPSIPVLGAVGEPGLNGGPLFWWLSVGVVAGLVAALVVGLARRRARFDETALAGGLSGLVGGLLVSLLCSLAGGGLGEARLSHIGPTTSQLIIVAPVLLGLAGLVGGALLGLIRRPHRAESVQPAEPATTPEEGGADPVGTPAESL